MPQHITTTYFMIKTIVIKIAMLLCLSSLTYAQTIPQVASGSVTRITLFKSKFIEARNVDIWLPDGYNIQKKYNVLYMHDGQMLFDSTQTWNKKEWGVDEAMSTLIKEGKIKDCIVVGIWNGGKTRHTDYFPQKPYQSLTKAQQDFVDTKLKSAGRTTNTFKPQSDNYLKFLVTELKPFIDKKYAVYKDKAHTFIAGSSMGGLISMYALTQYPQVFGGAACLSTHWVGIFEVQDNPIPQAFYNYLEKKLPNAKNHKLYFDYGDQTLDALYPPLQAEVDKIMRKKGWTEKSWITLFFKGENHSEQAWSKRLANPLLFLLEK